MARRVVRAMLVSPLPQWIRWRCCVGPLRRRSVAGTGPVGVLGEGHVADVVQPVLDVPLQTGPFLQASGLGVGGGQ